MTGRHDFIGHCGPRIIAPITSGTCDDLPFYKGYNPSWKRGPKSHPTTTRSESTLTYTAASHPLVSGAPRWDNEGDKKFQLRRGDINKT
ncbi:hypothetical protein AVEN_75112-1 [Araneus ventricosus]|uniref:Uncharacterized protein n=1 Tax=Araneus ventricosus TaxID=182803 RepID=A0A4Y2TBU5_ARAVE|nr:hypothetical protein AVEN_75112-1 [Araneus ventricosus]